jgi:1-acyl-sn-glycerol-3-phosphate acyltransferase
MASISWLAASLIWNSDHRNHALSILRAREMISHHCARFLARLDRLGCIVCEYEGFEDARDWHSSLLCANHPSLFDALLLFQKISTRCLRRGTESLETPPFSLVARQAAYIPSLPALRMLKETRRVVAEGGCLIVFPEGTRTGEGALGRFHEGFALAAIKGAATVRTIFIECTSRFLGKTFSLRSALRMPIRFRISTGEVFHPSYNDCARSFSKSLETYFRESLVRDGESIRRVEPTGQR